MANNHIEFVLNELQTTRLQRLAMVADRERGLRETCPDLKALDLSIARAARLEKGLLPNLYEQRRQLLSQWLSDQALPADWLTPPPDCAKCGDTGYVQGALCACVRNEAARRMFAEAGLTDSSPSFTRFNLEVFPDKRLANGHTLREQMERIRDYALNYATHFPSVPMPNLLFSGRPGCGKTFLLDSIAGRVIERGFWVVRATAFSVNDLMAKAMFDRADPDSLFACDLLALDDLGTEPIFNKVTINSFFNLVNERLANGKPTIISTNLTTDEILKRYGDRIFSRITDQRTTRIFEFEGVDLRKCGG